MYSKQTEKHDKTEAIKYIYELALRADGPIDYSGGGGYDLRRMRG